MLTLALLTLVCIYTCIVSVLYALCISAGEPVYGCVYSARPSAEAPRSPTKAARKARPTLHGLPSLTGYAIPRYLLPTELAAGEYGGMPSAALIYCAPGVVDCAATDRRLGRDSGSARYRRAVRGSGGAGTIWAHAA